MKKPLHLAVLLTFLALSSQLMAQRYTSEIFSAVDVDQNIVYGENYSVLTGTPTLQDLHMDVYTPVGDTASSRYLVILMHAGSFLPKGTNTLPFGTKEDSSLVEICTQFAKRGWTAASINYRLGWNPTPDILGGDQETRASTIIQAVYRAMQDGKTAIRWFRKNAATGGNTYNIDPERIVIGGSNSGGYAALACGNIDKTSELQLLKFLDNNGNSFVDPAIIGGFEGEGGATGVNMVNHEGYASNPQLILNLGGAVGDTSWIDAGEVPVVAFHGEADALTPYMTADVIVAATGDVIIEVSGSFDALKRGNGLGNQDKFINANFTDAYTMAAAARTPYEGLFPFPGAANGFEPWAWYDPTDTNTVQPPNGTGFGSAANPLATKAKALLYIDTIMGYFNPRAIEALTNPAPLDENLSVADITLDPSSVSIYPNPATDQLTIYKTQTNDPIRGIELRDITGKIVRSERDVNGPTYTFSRNNLPGGIYLLQVNFDHGIVTKKVIFK